MNPFEELTLFEAEEMADLCFEGKDVADVSPFAFAGAVLFMHRRRENPSIEWDTFKRNVSMKEIAEVSERMDPNAEGNPTNGAIPSNVSA